jgi:hypothetical protein
MKSKMILKKFWQKLKTQSMNVLQVPLGGFRGKKYSKMKKSTIVFVTLLLFISIISCRNNRLKTDEKKLAKEILASEKERSMENGYGNQLVETGNVQSGAFRKKEIRKADPERPPVLLDIPGTQSNTRNLKLSDVASSIRYVKLQTPPDTLLLYDHFFYRPDLDSKVRSDGEQIIFEGLFGLTCFNMDGEYQETIWKNETGIRFYGSKLVSFGGQDFFGVPFHIPVSLSNGNLYFAFHDGPAGNGQVMKYKPGTSKKLSAQSQAEVPGQRPVPGDTLFNKKQFSEDRFRFVYGIGPDTWAGLNNEWIAGTTGVLLVTYNDNGDTICKFSDYNRIINFNAPQSRRAAELVSYSFKGLLTIKQEYNDTVFRLIGSDRLLPVYNIDFGKFKVNYMDGLNASIDLSDKYILNSLHETNDFILLRYTQNSDSPDNRKKNAVKFYNAFYDKKERKLYHLPGFTPLPEGLANDLDGGMPFWPDFITPQDEMMKLVSGRTIKDYVHSEEFKTADISQENRRKQISLASSLRATDMVIVIVK